MIIPRSFGTHNGTFHADEVTACALLLYFNLIDREKIIRTRDSEKLAACEYVCDVGGEFAPSKKRFDHHQVSYAGELSSAGMVWAYLKDQGIVSSNTYFLLNRSLIQGVDAHDNGKANTEPGVCTFSQIISNFVPVQYDVPETLQDQAFFQALDFVVGHLKRSFERFAYIEACREKVVVAMAKKELYLYFNEAMPWMDIFFEMGGEQHPAQFIVMPSGRHWKVRGIPPTSEDRMKVRRPLPERWAGLLEKELKEETGIPGAIFCHKGRFISVWETKEDAFKALEYVLAKESK
jgi:uncharacterized UPF0160 family protein